MLDAEMLVARMNLGHRGIGVDRLEPDAEFPDLGEVVGLRAFADPTIPLTSRSSKISPSCTTSSLSSKRRNRTREAFLSSAFCRSRKRNGFGPCRAVRGTQDDEFSHRSRGYSQILSFRIHSACWPGSRKVTIPKKTGVARMSPPRAAWSKSSIRLLKSLLARPMLAFLHELNLVVRGAGDLIFNGLAAGAVAHREALNAVSHKLFIFGEVIGLRRAPFLMVPHVERIAGGTVGQWVRSLVPRRRSIMTTAHLQALGRRSRVSAPRRAARHA